MWRGLNNGTFQVFSSDHAPYRFDETGKLHAGPNPPFKSIANGVPGIELRMPLLFSEGVGKGRMSINEFVALTSTNAARIYGLHPRKGTIAVGCDADIAIWDPDREVTVRYDMLHDNVGYTPYEGMQLTGWPETVISRGRVVVRDGDLHVSPEAATTCSGHPATSSSAPAASLRPNWTRPPTLAPIFCDRSPIATPGPGCVTVASRADFPLPLVTRGRRAEVGLSSSVDVPGA